MVLSNFYLPIDSMIPLCLWILTKVINLLTKCLARLLGLVIINRITNTKSRVQKPVYEVVTLIDRDDHLARIRS